MFIAGDKIIIAWELFGADRDARITPISRQFRDLRVNLNAMNSLERMKEGEGCFLRKMSAFWHPETGDNVLSEEEKSRAKMKWIAIFISLRL